MFSYEQPIARMCNRCFLIVRDVATLPCTTLLYDWHVLLADVRDQVRNDSYVYKLEISNNVNSPTHTF